MKNIVRSFVLLSWFTVISSAQTIPNAGFETWAAGTPTGWYTSNILTIYVPVTQSTSVHSGSFAVQGTVVRSPAGTGYSPSLIAGQNGVGFPINFRPGSLHGWYKFSSDSGDAFSATIAVMKKGTSIGSGIYSSPTPKSIYSEFAMNVTYLSTDIPDTAFILVIIANSKSVHVGSTFTLDDLSFGVATDVKEAGAGTPYSFALDQNYPNPFNPTTNIRFRIPDFGFASLKVYDLLGREIRTLVNEELNAGSYQTTFDAAGLASGIYMYRLQSGKLMETKKLSLLR